MVCIMTIVNRCHEQVIHIPMHRDASTRIIPRFPVRHGVDLAIPVYTDAAIPRPTTMSIRMDMLRDLFMRMLGDMGTIAADQVKIVWYARSCYGRIAISHALYLSYRVW
jgi:hypothetical protein